MICDSALGNILPWQTNENQLPINQLQIQLNALCQMTNQKASTQPIRAKRTLNPRAKTYGRVLLTATAMRDPKSLQKTRTWSFNYQEAAQCQSGDFSISQGKMRKLLEMSSNCSPIKATEMSTKATQQNSTQPDESSYCSRYNSKEVLKSFTNSAIKSIRHKPTYEKITFSEFVEAKNLLAKSEKFSHRPTVYTQPEVVKSIHARGKPQQFKTVIHPKIKTCQLQSYLTDDSIFEKRGIKTNRRRLYSSKKRCQIGKQESMEMYLSEELSSFNLVPQK